MSHKKSGRALQSMESMRSEDTDSFSRDKSRKNKKTKKSEKNLQEPKSEIPSKSYALQSENNEASVNKKAEENEAHS